MSAPRTIAIVVAVAADWAIGKDNKMPWHMPADLKNFKELTMDFPVVMGRKTFESLGKPLKGRQNIVITNRRDYHPEGATVTHSLKEALEAAGEANQIFIIGGRQIYGEALEKDIVDIIYLTRIHETFEADVFFDPLKPDHWDKVAERPFLPDSRNPHAYTFETYIRKRR